MADALDDDFAYSDDEVYQGEAGMAESVDGADGDNNLSEGPTQKSKVEKPSQSKGLKATQNSQDSQDTREGTDNKKRLKRQKLRQQSAQKKNVSPNRALIR